MSQSFVRDMSTEIQHTKNQISLTPKLRFKEFTQDWVFGNFGDVVEVVDSLHITPDEYVSDGFPMIRVTDVNDGVLNLQNCLRVSEDVFEEFTKKHRPKLGDIIMSRVGTCGASIKLETNDKVCLGQNTVLLRPQIDSNFLHSLIRSRKIQNQVDRKVVGSTQKTLSLRDLKKFLVTKPSLPEQQKIASFLSAVDEKIQQLTRKKELLEQYKKGLMQKLFSGKLRFKDENGKPYPRWEFKNGDELFESITDKNHNSDLPILAITQEYGAIPRDLIDYSISVTDKSVESYKVVQIGDFIISLRSFQGGIEYSSYKGICSPAYIILRPTIKLERSFYKHYFKTENYIRQLNKNIEGIRDGKMISFKYFSEVKLPFPSVKEQQRISSFISAMDAKIQSVANQLGQAQKFKKGLLQQMFV